uniref:Uncharacterized protein n=1 Tax=Pyropia pulchra TaxID=60925 RepID=O24663_9RHOD|nr:ORF1 [Pyropia pulchra]
MAKSRKQISAEARLRRKAENKQLISKYIPAEYYPLCIKMLGDETRLIKTLTYYQTLLVSTNDNLLAESSHDEDPYDSKYPDTPNTAGDIFAPKASDKYQDAADSKNSKENLVSKILSEVSRRPSKGEPDNQNLKESLETIRLDRLLDTSLLSEGEKRLSSSFMTFESFIESECSKDKSISTRALR